MTIDEFCRYIEKQRTVFTDDWASFCELTVRVEDADELVTKLRELEHDLKNALHNEGVFGNRVTELEAENKRCLNLLNITAKACILADAKLAAADELASAVQHAGRVSKNVQLAYIHYRKAGEAE